MEGINSRFKLIEGGEARHFCVIVGVGDDVFPDSTCKYTTTQHYNRDGDGVTKNYEHKIRSLHATSQIPLAEDRRANGRI